MTFARNTELTSITCRWQGQGVRGPPTGGKQKAQRPANDHRVGTVNCEVDRFAMDADGTNEI